jgi:hypothetical protein
MSHKSKADRIEAAMDKARRRFVESYCDMPFHYCATGTPIPKEGRLQIDGCEKELRQRYPCEYYKEGQGCTNMRHPKYSREWKLMKRERGYKE